MNRPDAKARGRYRFGNGSSLIQARFAFRAPSSIDWATGRHQQRRSRGTAGRGRTNRIRGRNRARSVFHQVAGVRPARERESSARYRRGKVFPGRKCRATRSARKDYLRTRRSFPQWQTVESRVAGPLQPKATLLNRRARRFRLREFLTPFLRVIF